MRSGTRGPLASAAVALGLLATAALSPAQSPPAPAPGGPTGGPARPAASSGSPAAPQGAPRLPPPDVRGLVPLAALPADKPPVPLPAVPLPAPRQALPALPEPALVSDLAHRPHAPLLAARALACNPLGTVLGVASELVECGRARLQRGELEEARQAFQAAMQGASDRLVAREARYWLGETLLRLRRLAEADRVLGPVAQDDPRGEIGLHAQHEMGWIALESGNPARALQLFDGVTRTGVPAVIVPYVRHGRALALYGLKRFDDARKEWHALGGQRVPQPLAVELNFWVGDTLGRLGDTATAVARLATFTSANPTLLAEQGLLRLGWWSRAARQPQEAVRAWRTLVGRAPNSREALWARAGLVLALLDLDDHAAARQELQQLEAVDRSGALARPVALALRERMLTASRGAEAKAFDDQLLAGTLEPDSRAWVLLTSAEQSRSAGEADAARDRYELVRQNPVVPAFGWYASLRLAQLDFEAREFVRSSAATEQLLAQPLPDDLRAATLVLAGESAYWAGNHAASAAAYERFLADFSSSPQASQVRQALGWAEYRRGRFAEARERWTAFAREAPADRRAAEALLLSAELAARAGDVDAAQDLLRDVGTRAPNTPQADVAALNRAILALGAGRPAEALAVLERLGPRTVQTPYAGRIRLTRGLALVALKRQPEAQRELHSAVAQGEDALGRLGLGVLALEQGRWDVAAKEFGEARDAGAGPAAAAIDYGLLVARVNQAKLDDAKALGAALLARPPDPRVTPDVLRAMGAIAAEEKRWADARGLTVRLVDQYPRHDGAPVAVATLAAAAGSAGQWPLSREMYDLLASRYPQAAPALTDRLILGEAFLRTGSAAEARRELDAFVRAAPHDSRAARAAILLAEAQEAAGDRTAAADTLARFALLNPTDSKRAEAMLGAGRLLQAQGRWSEARGQLERAVNDGDGAVLAEAGYRLGEGLRSASQHEEAVEAYMTAAYLGGDTVWGRRAMLGAASSFAALKQREPAVALYNKLLALSNLEPDLAEVARRGLQNLGAN